MSDSRSPALPRRRLRRGLIGVGVLVLAAAAVAAVAILPGRDRKEKPKKIPPVNVEVMKIQPIAEMPEVFVLHGEVEANLVVDVSAEVAGRIERIHLAEGKPCGKDADLIDLNKDLLAAEWRRAKATAQFAKEDLRQKLLLQKRSAATQMEVDLARSQADAGKAAQDIAKANLDRATIQTPIQGILNEIPVEKGEYITAGTKVAQIVDVDTVKVVIAVPELHIHWVKLGDEHRIFRDFHDGSPPLKGTVTYVSELAEKQARTTRVELTVDNADRALRVGQIVRVELTLRTLEDVVMVPLMAVIPLEHGKVVYVVTGGKAERREVTLSGLFKGHDVRVKGLDAGEMLIVKGHRLVAPGQAVQVVQPK